MITITHRMNLRALLSFLPRYMPLSRKGDVLKS
jgi:hypothetical protein